jgi:hypothetical protein
VWAVKLICMSWHNRSEWISSLKQKLKVIWRWRELTFSNWLNIQLADSAFFPTVEPLSTARNLQQLYLSHKHKCVLCP